MAEENKILVLLDLDTGEIVGELKQVEKQAKKTGKKAGKNIEKGITDSAKKAVSAFSSLRNQVLGIGAAISTAFAFNKAITEAIKAQDAIQGLNTALSTAGTFSQIAKDSILEMAETMEETTRFTAEQFIEMTSLAQSYTKTAEAAQELTAAGVDFATGAGISFEEAVRRLGRGVQGATGDIANFVPEIRDMTKAQLTAGDATRLLAERFSGAAAENAKTFSGTLIRLTNAFGGVVESIGNLIVKSPRVVKFIDSIIKSLIDLSKFLTEANPGAFIDALVIRFKVLLIELTAIALFVKRNAIFLTLITGLNKARLAVGLFSTEFKLQFNSAIISGNSKLKAFTLALKSTTLAMKLMNLGAKILKATLSLGVLIIVDQLIEAFVTINEKTKSMGDTFVVIGEKIRIAFLGVFKKISEEILEASPLVARFFGISESTIESFNKRILESKTRIAELTGEIKKLATPDEGASPLTVLKEDLFSVGDGFDNFAAGFTARLTELRGSAAKDFKAIGAAAVQNMAGGVGGAFAAMGKAIAKGENALDAFLNSLVAAFGQMAIQLGTQFILQGIAYSWAGMPNGPPLIAAGAALATLGGVLSAVGGGGGDTSAAGAGTASDIEAPEALTEEGPELQDRRGEIVINVEGTVIDPAGAAQAISELLTEFGDSNDLLVNV